MPKWIWQLPKSTLNWQTKRFLAYIWWCYDIGCHDWNYSLAKRFKVSRATVKRWLAKLKKLHLINVQSPGLRTRTIYRMPYFSREIWLVKSGLKDPNPCGSKMSHIYNAQHSKSYTTAFTMHAKKEPPTAKEFSSTTQGGQTPLKPPERKLHGSGVGSGRKRQEKTEIIGDRIQHPRFRQLLKLSGDTKTAIFYFDLERKHPWIQKDIDADFYIDEEELQIEELIGVT